MGFKQSFLARTISSVAAVGALSLLLASCSASGRPAEDYELRLGVTYQLGETPQSLEELAVRLAVDEVNAADQGIKIELVPAPVLPEEGDSETGEDSEEPAESGDTTEPETTDGEGPDDGESGDDTEGGLGEGEESDEPVEEVLPPSELTGLIAEKVHFILSGSDLTITESMVKELVRGDTPLASLADPLGESYSWVSHSLYLKFQPAQRLLGQAIAQKLVLDGHEFIGVIGVRNDHGANILSGLNYELETTLSQVVAEGFYDVGAANLHTASDWVLKHLPQAIVLLGDTEMPQVARILINAGYPAEQIYLVGYLAEDFAVPGNRFMEGAHALLPEADASEEFVLKLEEALAALGELPEDSELQLPSLEDASFSELSNAQTAYDAVMMIALTALQNGLNSAKALGEGIRTLSSPSEDAVQVSNFVDATEEMFNGVAIDYQGYIGGLAFGASGEMNEAQLSTAIFGERGELTEIEGFIFPNQQFIDQLPKPPETAE